MASPDPQLHSLLVRRQHGYRDHLDPPLQPTIPIQRVEGDRNCDFLVERFVVYGVLRGHCVSAQLSSSYCFSTPSTRLNACIRDADPIFASTPAQPSIHPLPSSLPPYALSSTTIALPRDPADGIRDDRQYGDLRLYSRVWFGVSSG